MAQMIRKQVYIEKEQDAMLKRMAKRRGVTEAEIIRQAIERQLHATQSRRRDLSAWEEEKAFIRSRMKLKVPQRKGDRGWTREELYEER